jgi:hypothetical protein
MSSAVIELQYFLAANLGPTVRAAVRRVLHSALRPLRHHSVTPQVPRATGGNWMPAPAATVAHQRTAAL